jgi:gliding motility-associated-like protein
MKLFLQILIGILLALNLQSQEPASFNCLEVDDNGNTTLRWTMFPIDPDLDRFVIYYSTNGVSFDSIGSTPALSFSYFHPGANADLGSKYYYIKAVYNSGISISDTLRTIYLQVDNNPPDFNQADLYWNPVSDPLLDAYSGFYKILREFPPGNWTLYDSVPTNNTTYSEPVITCYDSITYRIIIENSIGCSSVSNSRGAVFKDVEYPLEPLFDSVSINADEFPVLGWTPSESEDVTGYIVYKFENNNWIEIDRIPGRDSTFYIDSVADPCNQSYSYAIAALDSCENKSPGTFEKPRNTILLNDIEYSVCDRSNTLTWSAYNNADPSLEQYNIYFSLNGGPFSLAGQATSNTLSFTHENITPGSVYTYFVQAVFGNKTSSSCKKMVSAFAYREPAFVYFANADVLPSNNIELTIDVDTNVNVCTWNIFRNDPQAIIIAQIAGISKTELNSFPLTFTDENVDPTLGPYFYYVEVLDSCEKTALTSNYNKTIFLSAANSGENLNHLQWNAFEGWDAGVEKYFIYRMVDGIEPTSPIDSVEATVLEYDDDITAIDNSSGQLIYWVQAVENDGDGYGFKSRSNSNRTAVAIAAEMFMPNAFRPGGVTPEFKPVYRFFGGSDYSLQIFNRWGQLIFETKNPEDGWDGKYKGNPVPLGVYVYKLFYQNPEQDAVVKRGTVMVVY